MLMDLRPIHLFGDSIGKGILFDENRGRYAIAHDRCETQLQSVLGVPVENHARMGATVAEGLIDLQEAGDLAGSLVAIEYGGNDCDLNWSEVAANPGEYHEAKIPLEKFRKLLTEFIQKVRALGAKPLLITPPPLDAQRFFHWVTKNLDAQAVLRYLKDVQNIYRWQEQYAAAVWEAALQAGCEVFDLRGAFLVHRDVYDYMSLDGMHPNARGHMLIAEAALRPDQRYMKMPAQAASPA